LVKLPLFFFCSLRFFLPFPPTFSRYSGFGTKLSPIFGFAKSFQIQNQLSIKPIAQIRCSVCYLHFIIASSKLHLKCRIYWLCEICKFKIMHQKATKYLYCCTHCCTFVSRCTRLKTLYLQYFHSIALLYKYSTTFLKS